MKKPHIRHGRFYNTPADSVFALFKNVIQVAGRISVEKLQGKRTKEKLLMTRQAIEAWIFSLPVVQQSSVEPVITWLGHATFLIQIAGVNIITDPVFFNLSVFMPRLIPLPIRLEDLPPIDVVLLSHNHMDHLDEFSVLFLKKYQPIIYAPMGDEAWFQSRGFTHVHGYEWWEWRRFKNITFTFLPASHWSGRGVRDINRSLWGSWMIQSEQGTVYFAGDTAYASHFKVIGEKFSSIDVALMPIGPEEPRDLMKETHTGSLEAIQAFIELGARCFIPMHWGTFAFGLDALTLPIERLKAFWAAHQRLEGKELMLVQCGQPVQLKRGQG